MRPLRSVFLRCVLRLSISGNTVLRVPLSRPLAADDDLPARSSIADPSPKTNGLTSGRLVCYKVVWSRPGALAPSMVSRRAARGRRAGGWGDAAAARGEKKGACRVGREVAHPGPSPDPDKEISTIRLFRRCGSWLYVSTTFTSSDDMLSNVSALGMVLS